MLENVVEMIFGPNRWGLRRHMCCIAFVAMLSAIQVEAAEIPLSWTFASTNMNGTPLTDLAGAKVYYGTSSSNYISVIDVPGGEPGEIGTYTVSNLTDGVTYYFNGTAYNTAGLESDFCDEISRNSYLYIRRSPTNTYAFVSQSAVFSVEARGEAPIHYQWKRDGAAVPGATNMGYTVDKTLISDNNSIISVTVNNHLMTLNSGEALLFVAYEFGDMPAPPANIRLSFGD